MSPLGEAFRRAMEGGGRSSPAEKQTRTDALPQFDLGEPIAPPPAPVSVPSFEFGAAPPVQRTADNALSASQRPADVRPPVQSMGMSGSMLSKAVRVATFAEGPLAPGLDELAGLRAALMASGLEGMTATILIAGTAPAHSITAIAVGLAGELARDLVHNVLLVDADVRSPGIASMLQVDPEFDFADVLDGRAEAAEAVLHSEGDNLSAMVLRNDPLLGGSRVTAESLAGPVARDLLTSLNESFDYVVIDAGTVEDTAVPRVLAARSTCVIMVVENGTTRDEARACRSTLESAGGRIMGVVLAGRTGGTGTKG